MAKQLIDPADKFSCQNHVVEKTAPGAGTYKGIWKGADVIYAYTRQQAIDDGVLVDLMQPGLVELVHNAGIKFPGAMTAEAFGDYVELTPMAKEMCNDIKGRLWDVLWMFSRAALRSAGNELLFKFYCVTNRRQPSECTLKAILGPGDQGEPVITLMHPWQD
jgi:hypothetical protein